MLKRMSCHRMASSSLWWPLMMSVPPMLTSGSASTLRAMCTTCAYHKQVCSAHNQAPEAARSH